MVLQQTDTISILHHAKPQILCGLNCGFFHKNMDLFWHCSEWQEDCLIAPTFTCHFCTHCFFIIHSNVMICHLKWCILIMYNYKWHFNGQYCKLPFFLNYEPWPQYDHIVWFHNECCYNITIWHCVWEMHDCCSVIKDYMRKV